jgi:hypothetical protein
MRTTLEKMVQEKIELFLAYLSIKGTRQVQREWMAGQGPWYSIWVRNTYGVAGIRNLRKKLGK